jgi:DNA-binding transcriptional LysR family regulator
VDVCVGLLSGKPPTGVSAMPLLKLPLVLLVPKGSKLKSARELWARDRISDTLIALPAGEMVTRVFEDGLAKLKVDWFTGIEVSSLEMVQTYAANGYGIGLSLQMPKKKIDPRVRALPLEGFEPLTLGALWQGGRNPLLDAFFKIVENATRKTMEGGDLSLLLVK